MLYLPGDAFSAASSAFASAMPALGAAVMMSGERPIMPTRAKSFSAS